MANQQPEYFNWILQQDFNKIYTTLENNQIIKPPYLEWRVPHTFYFSKRWWFAIRDILNYIEIYDIKYWEWDLWTIWLVETDVPDEKLVVKKNWIEIFHSSYSEDKNHKFIFWPGVKWDIIYKWEDRMSNWIDTTEWPYFEDTSWNFTEDLTWKYLYIYDAKKWYWESFRILENTSTRIYVNWYQWTTEEWSYIVTEQYWDTLYFLWWDWLYWLHNLNWWILHAKWFWELKDIEFFENRFFWLDINNNIICWMQTFLLLFINQSSYITTITGLLNLTVFNDYLLLLAEESINLIKKVTQYVDWVENITFTTSLVTRDFWIFNKNAYNVFNEWLYILDSHRKFVALSLTPVTDERFMVSTTDEWIYIQKYLDNISRADKLRISIDTNEIRIFVKKQTWTDIFIYDRYYLGWHMWNTVLPISNYYWPWEFFYWDNTYTTNENETSDYMWWEIVQKIKLIIWEENLTSFKRIIFHKMILWQETTKGFLVRYDVFSWSDRVEFFKNIDRVRLLDQWELVIGAKWWTLWQVLLWLWLLADWWNSISNLYPLVWTVKVNLWVWLELMLMELVADKEKKIVYWWQVVAYEIIEPGITDPKNVL